MPYVFVSHATTDNLIAEAMRCHLVEQGWHESDVYVDFSADGVGAHEVWKHAIAKANLGAHAVLCLISEAWLLSTECLTEFRLAETKGHGRIVLALLGGVTKERMIEAGFGERQLIELEARGSALLIPAQIPGSNGHPGGHDDVRLNELALKKIRRSLYRIGTAPHAFEWKPARARSPYPGLEAFSEQDAAVFFGREARIASAIEGLRDMQVSGPRMLTILSSSGVGKSSFLRAGVWPRLYRQAGLAPAPILRPANHTISGQQGLYVALSQWWRDRGLPIDPGQLAREASMASTLAAGVLGLLERATDACGPHNTLVVGIDQAEELYLTVGERAAAEASALRQAMLTLVSKPRASILFVLTIRSDSWEPLAEDLVRAGDEDGGEELHRLFELGPLSQTAYRDVIRRPAKIARETEADVFDPALVERLVDTFTGADALPLLAMTLHQLFASFPTTLPITVSDYEALYGTSGPEGPVRRALETAALQYGSGWSEDLLHQLLVPGLVTWDADARDGEGAAKRRIASEVSLVEGRNDLARLVNVLVSPQVRLLVRGRDQSEVTLEVAHEALLRVSPINQWVSGQRDRLALRDTLDREARAWVAAKQQSDEAMEGALAARRGPRLQAALELIHNPMFQGEVSPVVTDFLDACTRREQADRDTLRLAVARGFVMPTRQAMAEGRSDRALRLIGAAAVLSDDPELALEGGPLDALLQGLSTLRLPSTIIQAREAGIQSISLHPNGQHLAIANAHGHVRVVERHTQKTLLELPGHTLAARSVAWSPHGDRLATASEDETVRICDPHTGVELQRCEGHTGWVRRAVWRNGGNEIVSGAADGTARIWGRTHGT